MTRSVARVVGPSIECPVVFCKSYYRSLGSKSRQNENRKESVMSLKEYKPGRAFSGVIGRTFDVSQPAWPMPNRAKEGAPNVLFIVLDDTGFGQLGCYGSPINTPNINALAADGLRYNSMHTTALCSP